MARGILRLVKDYDCIVQRAPAHEGKGGDLNCLRLHIFLQLLLWNHILQRIVERLQVRVYLVFHVAGKETEFLTRLHGRAGKDYLAAQLVFKRVHGKGYRDIGLARSRRTEREREVILCETPHHPCLVGVARSYGFAVLSVYYYTFRIHLLRRVSANNIYNRLFVKTVVSGRMGFYGMYLFLEFRSLALFSYNLDDIAARRHPQLREKIAYKAYICIVDPIKRLGIHIIDYYYSFDHQTIFITRNRSVWCKPVIIIRLNPQARFATVSEPRPRTPSEACS